MRILGAFAAMTATAAASQARLDCAGCGSNVVDRFFRVRAIPKVGEKGYFSSPTKIIEGSVVGGVTLNHLAWASLLGVKSGLMALQGDDAAGELVREAMKAKGVSTECVSVHKDFTTAESYVLSQPSDGERSIIMASGSTSCIDAATMLELWDKATEHGVPPIVTTEVSQVPLSGVAALLEAANAAGSLTVIDVDVSPSVCVDEARLGSLEDLAKVACMATVVKPTRHAAAELLALLKYGDASKAHTAEFDKMNAQQLTTLLVKATGARMVALTAGSEGCALATHQGVSVTCPAPKIPQVLDATGAGDAFLGGLLAGMLERIKQGLDAVPNDEAGLRGLGRLANAAGAACCQVLGGLPDHTSLAKIISMRGGAVSSGSGDDVGIETGYEVASGKAMGCFKESLARDAAALASLGVSRLGVSRVVKNDEAAAVVAGVAGCKGTVHVTGVGKSGFVGRRLAATLASFGVKSHFTHAAEWAHGNLGVACVGDVAICISHSGATPEVIAAATLLKDRGVPVFAIASRPSDEDTYSKPTEPSPLLRLSCGALTYALPFGKEPFGGAPTCSVVCMEALCNALAVEVAVNHRRFDRAAFKRNHPGGALGKAL